ncbi:hypothetical protein XELAEV_18046378mg [Xenopus laevis]|uniref:Uncharacterized protein n=1 Tax=Xenopus laevis TaxID=8355 RepID=A0A974BTN9_XENLA|nr:hypothetical protein XELAEV_18046378mg [Xenopus laevis]
MINQQAYGVELHSVQHCQKAQWGEIRHYNLALQPCPCSYGAFTRGPLLYKDLLEGKIDVIKVNSHCNFQPWPCCKCCSSKSFSA